MDIFFYLILSLLFTVTPLFVKAEGSFSADRKLLYLTLRFFTIKVITIRIFFDEDGPVISVNGKKGTVIHSKHKKKKKKHTVLEMYPQLIHIKEMKISAYTGGEITALSLAVGSILMFAEEGMYYLKRNGLLDKGTVRLLPCYIGERTTVNFSITLFTSIAQIFGMLVHTKKGRNYGKRSNREYHEQNA